MRYQIVENGVVVNTVLADAPHWPNWIQDDNAGIGWALVNGALVAPAAPSTVPTVPSSITMRQARLSLLAAGLLGNIDTAIAAMPSPQKERAQIEWQYSNDVLRHNGFVAALAPSLGLTDPQIDALFISGAQL